MDLSLDCNHIVVIIALVIVSTVLNRWDQVEALSFVFNGFAGLSDVYAVQQYQEVWTYNTDNQSLTLTPNNPVTNVVVGRFLYPSPVQMMEPGATSVKNFSTTFIMQIFRQPSDLDYVGGVGPGLAFIMVPDNVTVGSGLDYMGILTTETPSTAKNYASDNHTFAVEIDTHLNPEFNDPNDNHICIDVASLNTTLINTFTPAIPLTTGNIDRVQQVWIDHYIGPDGSSKIDIFHAEYPSSKPATPLGSQVDVDLSILKEAMYLGFSSSAGLESSNVHSIFAWSFSNEGEAPPIKIGSALDSPPAPSPRIQTVPAPSPSIQTPTASLVIPSPSSSSPSASTIALGIAATLVFLLGGTFCCWWKFCRPVPNGPPLCIFISHTGGEDGTKKNFAKTLWKRLGENPCYRVFIDCRMPLGIEFPKEILDEIQKTELAIVVVTEDYFKGRWPMLELAEFLKLYNENRQAQTVRVLPLFFMLTPDEVKDLLDQDEFWQNAWTTQMSIEGHRLIFSDVETYKRTVADLCNLNGIVYSDRKRDKEEEYIEKILKGVKETYIEMRTNSQLGSARV